MTILAVFNDMQIGGTTALCPPKVILDDEDIHQASPLQLTINDFWNYCWDEIKSIRLPDEKVIGALNGEPIDGIHHQTHQLWSTRREDQKQAALTLLEKPNGGIVNKWYITRGTQAHSENFGVTDAIAKELGAYKKRSHYRIELTIQGNKFLITHKGPGPGRRAWTWGNQIRYELKNQHIKSLESGRKMPDYFLWAHYHQKAEEAIIVQDRGKERIIRGFLVPGWQASTAYISSLIYGHEVIYIGMIYFIIRDGKVSWKWLVDERDLTEKAKI